MLKAGPLGADGHPVREVAVSIVDLCAHRVPDLDVKTGVRVTRWATVHVHDLPTWAFALLPLGPISSLVLRLARDRGVRVELPVTTATERRRRALEAGAAVALLVGVFLLAATPLGASPAVAGLGALLVLAGAVAATAGLSRVWIRGRLEGDVVRLRGVHRAFADGVTFLRALGMASPEATTPTLVRTGPRI
jgi:hypothetical protein